MSAIPFPFVMLVTDRAVAGGPERLVAMVRAAVADGVNAVQLREKDLPPDALLHLALDLREVTRGRALLFVNGDIETAIACGADGAHLPEAHGDPELILERPGAKRLLVSRAVHTVAAAGDATLARADLLVAGTVFPSDTHHGGRAAGVGLIADIRRAVAVPIADIGGIT
ncbi:MAG: thiamine phosphate synthase, partial [SAR202 cluster bacterium]|nr:thiamine phosphate synthase [SAR202 cluster bacterium]